MASFDASVLSTIPDRVQDPIENAPAKAMTLANAMDEQKLNQFTLANAEKQQKDQADIERIVKSGDYTTPQGYLKTASALTSAGHPQAAQDFMKMGASYSSGNYQQQMQRLEVAAKQQDVIAGAMDNILAKVDALKSAGGNTSPDVLNAVSRQLAISDAKQLLSAHPELTPQIQQFLKNPQNLTYPGIMELEKRSNLGQKLLAQHRQDLQLGLNQQKTAASVAEAKARTQALESGKLVPVQQPDGTTVYLTSSQAAGQKVGSKTGATMGPRAASILSEAVAEGVSLPTGGSRSAQVINEIFSNLADRYPNLSPQQIVAKIKAGELSMAGAKTEIGAVGRRQAGIETSAEEARNVIPIAIQASDAVPRGKFVPLNKLIQAGKISTSDPKLAAFAQANLTLANVYARAMSPTGTPTVEGREEALKKLSVATSRESYMAVVHVIQQEIDAARRAPGVISQDVLRRAGAAPGAPEDHQPPGVQGRPQGGAPAGGGSGATPPRISSDADYNALPSGSTFIAPDGTVRKKP